MKILLLHSPGEENLNGASHVAELADQLWPDHEYIVCLDPSVANLILAFGPAALRKLIKFKYSHRLARRELLESEWGPVATTYNAKAQYGAPQFLRIMLDDLMWAMWRVTTSTQRPEWHVRPSLHRRTLLGLDLETTSFHYQDPLSRILTGVAAGEDGTVVQAWDDDLEELSHIVNQHYGYEAATLAGHNIKFDMNWMRAKGIGWTAPVWDTEVAAGLLDDNITDNSLGFLTTRYTQIPHHKEMVDKTRMGEEYAEHPQVVMDYNTIDSIASVQIARQQMPEIEEAGLGPIMEFLMDMIPVFSRMEVRGVRVDLPRAQTVGREIHSRREKALQEFGYEINLNSVNQLRQVLFQELGLEPISFSDKTGDPSTKRGDLETMLERLESGEFVATTSDADRRLRGLLDYRKYDKLWGTYFAPLPAYTKYDGRIHSSWQLVAGEFGGAKTGRTSSRKPNLQNIPTDRPDQPSVRSIFTASDDHHWWSADYSGLEMRIVAELARDAAMLDIFDRERDIHTGTMAQIWGDDYDEVVKILSDKEAEGFLETYQRRLQVKRAGFLILYGGGASRLAALSRQEGVDMSYADAQGVIDSWFNNFPDVRQWVADTHDEVIRDGYVRSITGRRRTLPGAGVPGPVGWRKLRQGTNTKIQSVASDICLLAMFLLDQDSRDPDSPLYGTHLLMNVHDEVSGETPIRPGVEPDLILERIRAIMTQRVPEEFERRFGRRFRVPLAIDGKVGTRWS